jgi:predicted nucleotidyltransferase
MAQRTDLKEAQKIVLGYVSHLRDKIDIKELYLFGSYVRKTNHIDSDIDIAVISDDLAGDCMDDLFLLMRNRRDNELLIEPHPFLPKDFNKDNPFAKEIIETGIRII